ncbi:MAG: MFS transporter [Proteobacteria bacterium]|nr:MFS transporter [Pseudomonadota bacterium]
MSKALVASCAAAFFMFGMTSSLLGPTINDLAAALGVSAAAVGLLRSGRQIGQFFGFSTLGSAADKYDLRLLALVGGFTMALALLFVSWVGFLVAACASVVWGFGHSIYNLAPNVIVGRVFEKNAPAVMTTLHGVYGIGAMAGPWIVEIFRTKGVFYTYAISATLVALSALLYAVLTTNNGKNTQDVSLKNGAGAKRIVVREIWPFLAAVILFNGAMFGAADWLYYYAGRAPGATAHIAAVATSSFWAALTIGRFLLGGLISRFGERVVMRGSAVGAVIGSVALVLPDAPQNMIIASALMLGAGLAAIYPVLMACAANLYPESRGIVTGNLAAAGAFGAIILPALQGWLISELGVGMVLILASAFLLSIVVWMLPLAGAPIEAKAS